MQSQRRGPSHSGCPGEDDSLVGLSRFFGGKGRPKEETKQTISGLSKKTLPLGVPKLESDFRTSQYLIPAKRPTGRQ